MGLLTASILGIQRNNGGVALSRKPLDDIMKAIKTLAVRVENPTVARDRLHNMSQDREESVRAFGARLRGQAAICQYTKACTCLLVVNYTEENVADALITGLADPEIKQGLLGEPDQPLSMERAMLYVESKEAAKTSVSLLDPVTSMGAIRQSGYRKTPRMQHNTYTDDEKCCFCGKTGHGKYPRSLYVAPNAMRSATPVGNVENRTTLTECASQSNPRLKMPSLAHVATSRPTGREDVAHSTTTCSTQQTTDG